MSMTDQPVRPIEVLLVEDDEGDVLMTRRRWPRARSSTGSTPSTTVSRPSTTCAGPASTTTPRGPTSSSSTSTCRRRTGARYWRRSRATKTSAHPRDRADDLRGRRGHPPQLQPPRQRLRHQAGRLRPLRRRHPADRRLLHLGRPPAPVLARQEGRAVDVPRRAARPPACEPGARPPRARRGGAPEPERTWPGVAGCAMRCAGSPGRRHDVGRAAEGNAQWSAHPRRGGRCGRSGSAPDGNGRSRDGGGRRRRPGRPAASRPGEVEGNHLFLAHEEHDVAEPADGEEGVATDHRPTGHEVENRRDGNRSPSGAAGGSRPSPRSWGRGARRVPTRVRRHDRQAGWASNALAARVRAPGAHHESSSAKATYGVVAAATPSLRAGAWFSPSSSTRTSDTRPGRPPACRRWTRCRPRRRAVVRRGR